MLWVCDSICYALSPAQVIGFGGLLESRSTAPCSWRSLTVTGYQYPHELAHVPLHSLCDDFTVPRLACWAYRDGDQEMSDCEESKDNEVCA
jgi:hypothetical protein